jgi:hypothetical protein
MAEQTDWTYLWPYTGYVPTSSYNARYPTASSFDIYQDPGPCKPKLSEASQQVSVDNKFYNRSAQARELPLKSVLDLEPFHSSFSSSSSQRLHALEAAIRPLGQNSWLQYRSSFSKDKRNGDCTCKTVECSSCKSTRQWSLNIRSDRVSKNSNGFCSNDEITDGIWKKSEILANGKT